jgi:cysteine-rich repeat protein
MYLLFNKNLMKKYLLAISIVWLTSIMSFASAKPASFQVEISPTFKINEFVDVTIKAVWANGQVDTSYKNADMTIEVEDEQGMLVASKDVVLPSNGFAYMEASELGVKVLSKWLTLKKPGKFKIIVKDLFDPSLMGSGAFTVIWEWQAAQMGTIQVTSPTSNSTQQSKDITIIGKTTTPNMPLKFLFDTKELKDGLSDAQGAFTVTVTGLQPGPHELIVNGLDLGKSVVATSGPIKFTIEESKEVEMFAKLSISPSKSVMVNTLAKFTLETNPNVISATLKIGDASPIPLTKISDGIFEGQSQMTKVGDFPLSVDVMTSNSKSFPNIDTIKVTDENRKILSLNGILHPNGLKADLSWTYTGTINFFKVQYSTDPDDLKLSLTTTKSEATIIIADTQKSYYAQVFPIDQQGTVNGEPSQIIEIKPRATCGNATLDPGEECDDGNILDGDGCTAQCKKEIAQPAPNQPLCGNWVLETGEECDDGNVLNGDSCTAQCKKETCNPPAGITLRTKKEGDRYYLVRDAVPNAQKYTIYRRDTQPSSMRAVQELSIVGETTSTYFEYPFDPTAQADTYAWYAVQAVCADGNMKLIDNIKKVKVWPRETLIVLLFLLSVMMYAWMRSGRRY